MVLYLALMTWSTAMAQPGGTCTAHAGTLSGYKPSDCLQEGGTAIGAIPNWDAVVPSGYATIYLLAEGDPHVIQQTRAFAIFDVYAEGDYSIHTLVYHPGTFNPVTIALGATTLADLNAVFIGGGGMICGSLDLIGTRILVDNPEVGVLTAVAEEVCLEDGSAVLGVTLNGAHVPEGYQVLYLLVDPPSMIAQTSATSAFTVGATGTYTIHVLVYDPATLTLGGLVPGVTTLGDINANLIQGGGGICAALDLGGAQVAVVQCDGPCTAYAGTLTPHKPADCLREGGTDIGAIPNWDAVVPAGFSTLYLLSDGQTIVQVREFAIFDVFAEAAYTIHTLVYDPATFDPVAIALGSTTIAEVQAWFIAGGGTLCGDLDVTGTGVLVEDPLPAIAMVFDDGPLCLQEGEAVIDAMSVGGQHVPQGYGTLYLLAQDGVVIATDAWSTFTVTEAGMYTVHDLIYHPSSFDTDDIEPGSTTLEELNAGLVQGGGGICAALGLEGFVVEVTACVEECLADAGTLTPFKPTDCIVDGASAVGGIANGDAVVPEGFGTVYLLSEGGVITATRELAIFDVDQEGYYTTHTLVYDPATFDIASIVPGTTTVAGLAELLSTGSLCAAFDATGVSTLVENPASGGTAPASATVCLVDGTATLVAIPDGEAHVPAGHTLRYVLTQGDDQVIVAIGTEPEFAVTGLDVYGIHTLVANPATLNISGIVIGTSVLTELEALLVQAGGSDCGVLDMEGAQFSVNECGGGCDAHAGSITPFLLETCLYQGSVQLIATADGNAMVPDGFVVIYLLSQDEVVVASSATPGFTVTDEAVFAIHTLVYHPDTYDPATALGVTVADIDALFEQGGGTLCAAIDPQGARTVVVACEEELCFAFPGSLNGGGQVCLTSDGPAALTAFPSGDATVPPGYDVVYLLSSGAEQTIHQVAQDPSFAVDVPDVWTIHTVVYDPAQWDPAAIVPGNTTCGSISDAFVQGGGAICGGIDMVGATFQVNECPGGIEDIGLTVWPVPAQDQVTVEVVRGGGGALEGAEVAVFNSRGAQVNGVRALAFAAGTWTMDVSNLVAGIYTIRVVSPNGVFTHRFVKAER